MRQLIDNEKRYKLRYDKIIVNNEKSFSKANIEALKDFLMLCKSEGLSSSRCYKYLVVMPQIITYLDKDLIKITKDDLIKVAGYVKGKNYTEQTKLDIIGKIKKFYKTITFIDKYKDLDPIYFWLYDKRNKFFSTNLDRTKIKKKTEKLENEDVKKLIEGADNFRDKAFFSIMATQGPRPQEILGIRKKDIELKEDMIQIEISGKTGTRYLFITEEFVITYLMNHLKTIETNEEYIFPISSRRMNDLMKEICYNKGVKKSVHLYKLRKYSVTQDRIKGISEGALEQKYGWVKGSNRVRAYDQSVSMDYKNELTRKNGVITEKPKQISDYIEVNYINRNKHLEETIESLKNLVKKHEERLEFIYHKIGNNSQLIGKS